MPRPKQKVKRELKTEVKQELGDHDGKSQTISDDEGNLFTRVWVKEEPVEILPLDPLDPNFVIKQEESDLEQASELEVEIEEQFEIPNDKKISYKKPTELVYCDQCDYSTHYKSCLSTHIMKKHLNICIKCEKCKYVAKDITVLNRHMAIKHVDKKPTCNGQDLPELNCDQCDYKTYYQWNLEAHKRKHKLEKKFQCPLCDFKTAFRNSLSKHTKIHKEKANFFYKCDKCPFVTKFSGHIQRHLAVLHNEVSENDFFCTLCNYSTRSKSRLKTHMDKNKKDTALKCLYESCGFETLYKCEFRKHKTTHFEDIYTKKAEARRQRELKKKENELANTFGDDTRNYMNITETEDLDIPDTSCLEENSEINNVTTEKIAKNSTHSVPDKILAKYSSQVYAPGTSEKNSKPNRNNYKIDPNFKNIIVPIIETTDGSRKFFCQKCEYSSRYKGSVQRHYRRQHTGNKIRPYQCQNCDFTTKTTDQINLHNKRSTSATEISCFDAECDFKTFFKCQMVMHQKVHYKYHCTKCPHSCKKQNELTRHYAVSHLGNGVKCRFCNFVANRKDSILVHEAIHTGAKPFKCEYCEYNSVRKAVLRVHMKRYHSNIQPELKIVTSNVLEDKIQSLQVIVPSYNEVKNDVDDEQLKISDQRVSLSENRILVGDKIVMVEDKEKINELCVVSLMGLIGVEASNSTQNNKDIPGEEMKVENYMV